MYLIEELWKLSVDPDEVRLLSQLNGALLDDTEDNEENPQK